MSMFPMMRRYGVTLTLFALAATGLVTLVNSLTAPRIAQQAEQQHKMVLDQVIPPQLYDNNPLSECYLISDPRLGDDHPHRLYLARKQGEAIAAAVESTAPDGYSGAIHLLIGADFLGKVLGVRTLEHHETPGLGDKIETRISDWITHFAQQQVVGENDKRWQVKKEGGMFDQFTGATITPRAVILSVKRTTLLLMQHPNIEHLPPCGKKYE